MSSGEADAVNYESIPVKTTSTTYASSVTGGGYWDSFGVWHPYNYYSTSLNFPLTIYKYQVFCPNNKCNAANWLELDKITPCMNCGAKLKAVSDKADYEVAVTT